MSLDVDRFYTTPSIVLHEANEKESHTDIDATCNYCYSYRSMYP